MLFNILALAGITIILTKSKLFEIPRKTIARFGYPNLKYFVSCSMCVGVWIGFIGWLVLSRNLNQLIQYVFITSIISWIIAELGIKLESS